MNTKRNKILFIVCGIICLLVFSNLFAQYSLSSPYSRFGIGYDNQRNNHTLSAMGGIGYAFARNNEINLFNAASYSQIEKQSFVFNMGFDVMWRNISNTTNSSNAFVGSITNISFAFPILDKLKAGISLTPITDINYLGSDTILSSINTVKTFKGNGGVNRFVVGLSYQILKTRKNDLSIGLNTSYYFGNIYRCSDLRYLTQRDTNGMLHDTIGFFDSRTETNYRISSFGVDLGLQYFYTLNNSDKIGFGLSFTPKLKLNTDKKQIFYTYYSHASSLFIQDTLSYSETKGKITMPMKIGFGLSYNKVDKLFAEIDLTYTQWSDFEFEMQKKNTLKDNWRVNTGVEYLPNISGVKYYEKIAYRFGFHYDNGYIFLQDKRIDDIGITFGIALPIKKLGTRINLSFDYGKQGTTNNNLIKENYFRIGLSLSAKDRWFIKRKYQ